jgi:hypothetical protein
MQEKQVCLFQEDEVGKKTTPIMRALGGLQKREYLATVRNKKVIDSDWVQGHYLPVISMVLGKGGRDDLGAGMF